MKLQLI